MFSSLPNLGRFQFFFFLFFLFSFFRLCSYGGSHKAWNCLSLSEREGDDLCFKKDRCSKEYIIAAQFLTKRALNMEAVAKTFKPLWRADNGFTVSKEGSHKALFVFDNKEDVDRILSGEP